MRDINITHQSANQFLSHNPNLPYRVTAWVVGHYVTGRRPDLRKTNMSHYEQTGNFSILVLTLF